jgi:hypothetical protein
MRVVGLSVLFTIAIAGCATMATGRNLQRESARAITPTPYPDSVKISDVQGGITSAKWVATTPSGVFDCSLQAGESHPLCAKRGTP